MYQNPLPTHGYFPLIVASWVYVLLVAAVLVVLRELGLSDPLLLVALVVVGAGLLVAFLPVFRRLTPARKGRDQSSGESPGTEES